jgi:hypothetical protein
MMDPIQAYYASAPTPQGEYLDEEQMAQRHGHVASAEPALLSRVRRRVGKALIHIGEKLAAENASIKWSNEAI